MGSGMGVLIPGHFICRSLFFRCGCGAWVPLRFRELRCPFAVQCRANRDLAPVLFAVLEREELGQNRSDGWFPMRRIDVY